MALFRKSKKKSESSDTHRSDPEVSGSQAKWDQLERLINEPDTSENPAIGDFGSQDLRAADTGRFESDLKIELPDDSEFVDVTPPETSDTPDPAPVAAMAPSAHFAAKAKSDGDTSKADPLDSFSPSPPAVSRPDRADIGAMRLDVARISADIQSGEELYRRAQQRIENLTGFVERAEIDFSMLNRLEPENRRLKARNRTIEREMDNNQQKMEVLRADLEDREHRLAEKTRSYEDTLGKLSRAQKSLQEYERALSNTRESSDRNALNSERLQTSLDVERRENEVLRDRITDIVTDMDAKQSAYIEAKKIADSLAQDCADYRHQAESAEKEADELRKSLAAAQTQNNAMKAEMVSLHEDIRTFKSQSEFTIISREDEMTALQLQVDHLTKQLDIKDEIVRNAARDVQELRKIRTAQDLERERLEAQIETQSYQLDKAQSDLLQTKQDVTDFDRRYRDVATALSVSQARRMSNSPAESPDIRPYTEARQDVIADAPDDLQPLSETKTDEFENMSSDEVSDRIMDFRLGLRKDLT
jgi:predicted  nucleic acid-binding Zn-ribbon protein